MIKVLNILCSNFGFSGTGDFLNSLIHFKLVPLTIALTGVGVILEKYLGLNGITLFSFGLLTVLELVTGLIASRIRGNKIESGKFARFGLKFFVWIILFFILNSLKNQYISDESEIASSFYGWLHTFIFGFVNMEYLISVLENLGVISGKTNNNLISIIKRKFGQLAGVEFPEKDKDKKDAKK